MSVLASREIRLRSRPDTAPTLDNFEVAEVAVELPEEGQVRIRNLYMSVDPYMVNRLYDADNYIAPFKLGRPLDGAAVARVLDSTVPEFQPGDIVLSFYGWREVHNAKAKNLTRLDDLDLPPHYHLGIAGTTGMTAYAGLFDVGHCTGTETVYVSAAAGAVGSTACQMAKIKGCTVIGSAGGPEKAAFLREIGVDHAIDYKAVDDLSATLAHAAPDGLDLYFDNVGGEHLKAALTNMKDFGRIVVSGMISGYSDRDKGGPNNLFEIVSHRLTIRGFLLGDHIANIREAFHRDVPAWIKSGKLTARETMEQGIENAPKAFLGLLAGDNIGKMLVCLDPDSP